MQRLDVLPFRAEQHPELGGLQVGLLPLMVTLPFAIVQALSDARLGQMVREAARPYLVLDLTAEDLRPESLQWIASTWAPMLYQVGIQRLAIVAKTPALAAPFAQGGGPVQIAVFGAGDLAGLRGFLGLPAAAAVQQYQPAPAVGAIPGGRSLPLALLPRTWGFATFVGALFGALLGGGMAKLWLALGGHADMAEFIYYGVGGILGLACGVAGVLAVHYARGIPRARIEWDDEGITELLNDKPATRIAWAEAQVGLLKSTLVYKNRGMVTGRSEGYTVQIRDRSGKSITFGDGHQHPDWLRNRPAWVESIPYEIRARGQAVPIVQDKLGLGRGALAVFGIVALLSYAALMVGSVGETWAGETSAMLLGLGCALFAIRMIWPLTKLGGRGTVSALVELALRSVVLLVYVGLALACWAHDQSP